VVGGADGENGVPGQADVWQPARMTKTKSSKTYARFYAHVHSKAYSSRSRAAYLMWVERLGVFWRSSP